MTRDRIYTFTNVLRAVLAATMMLLTGSSALAQQNPGVRIHGSVYGGGNNADVKVSTSVNMQTGTVDKNVYGGGNLGFVGTFTSTLNTTTNSKEYTWTVGGVSNVTISGGTVGPATPTTEKPGNVFGAGRGSKDTYECEPAMVKETHVNITAGTVNGTVYGGGELGRVEGNTEVTIGTSGDTGEEIKPTIKGNVFGAGAGVATHGYSALVRGNSTVFIQGKARVSGNVYGGGEIASVGRFKIVNSLPTEPLSGGTCTVTIQGSASTGEVYGACKGVTPDYEHNGGHWTSDNDAQPHTFTSQEEYLSFLKTLALTSNTIVKIDGSATVNGSVYGGGQRGITLGKVKVDVTGGTVTTDVYGGGALAHTNTENWQSNALVSPYHAVTGLTEGESVVTGLYTESSGTYTEITTANAKAESGKTYYRLTDTKVNLTGGTVRDVYGGGLGELGDNNETETDDTPANVYGPVTVTVTGGKARNVFGCNNVYGTPKSTVEVFINGTAATEVSETGSKTYALQGVYGGGNLAHYDPVTTGNYPTVTVNNCATSIKDVFGGGNAAAVPYTNVTINGGDIDRVFAGGNGSSGAANVGYKNSEITPTAGTDEYGLGTSNATIAGGTINEIYGGSNSKGTVRATGSMSIAKSTESGACPMKIGDVYGGGNQAPGAAVALSIGCTGTGENEGITNVYGGANAANVTGNISLTIEEGKIANVFGGNNTSGTISGTITVNINKKASACVWNIGNVYGGGNQAVYTAPTATESDANAHNYPQVNILNGAVSGDVFGGGLGLANDATKGVVNGNPQVTINGANASVSGGVYGGGSLAPTNGNPVVTLTTGSATNIYGGGMAANVNGAPTVNINGGTVSTGVYGGCNTSGTVAAAIVTLTGGIMTEVYGSGKGSGTTTNAATVYVGTYENSTYAGTATINGDVYGGSEEGAVGTTIVYLNSATTLAGHVFGGGKGRLADNTVTPNVTAQPATVTTSATVWQNNVTMASGKNIYGGCNVNGTAAATNVYVMGGTSNSVFGGGLGPNTGVSGNVSVNVGTYDSTNGLKGSGTVTSNVYGGSAQGTVNTANADPMNTTTVNLWAGTINGDVYGGGLGDATHSAAVNGKTIVNLNGDATYTSGNGTCVVKRYIFGGNDTNGSPAASEVHIYKTIDYDTDHTRTAETNLTSTTTDDHKYNLAAVYGGGNLATFTGSSTKVVIETCDPSIETVYGGGNAADANDTWVEVKGAYEIGTVFGGGNGADTSKPAANVNGKTEVYLNGGTIHEAYGGSNTNGDVTGGTNVTVSDNNTTCKLQVDHIYGGGKNADMSSGTNIVLGCQPDTWIEDIYAGSREADVNGDVSLTITSGKFERVFGANKTSGLLKGAIKVNIEETGGCTTPIIIGELYAGGNVADYSIYGYYQDANDNNKWKGRTKDQYDTWFASLTDEEKTKPENQIKADPQLNVRAFTSIGAIYGGGLRAKMYGNPTVSINVVKGSRSATVIGEDQYTPSTAPFNHLPYPAHAAGAIGTIGDVFGGGNLATVYGSTTVNIGTESTATFITEPTHLNKGTSLETSGVDYIQRSDGLYEAKTEGANITGNVYGGGKLADVTGNTQINICALYDKDNDKYDPVAEGASKVTIGVSGVTDANHGNVYGGGKGEADEFTCAKAMVGEENKGIDAQNNLLPGGTTVNIYNGTVKGNVYGGGEVGRVERNTVVTIGAVSGSSTPVIEGSVFGAGAGVVTHGYSALVRGNSTVTVQGNAQVRQNVYGGGAKASVGRYNVAKDAAEAAEHNVSVGMPYGLISGGTTWVTIQGNAVIGTDGNANTGHVYGAGQGIEPSYVSEGTNRSKRMSVMNDQVYTSANQDYWDYTDNSNQYVWEYFVDKAAYLKYVETLAISAATDVDINGENVEVKGSVFGGSENGFVYTDTDVDIQNGTVDGDAYGGGRGLSTYSEAGRVSGNTDIAVSGGNVKGNVYGGGMMGSVGTIESAQKNETIQDGGTASEKIYGFGLSWPYKFTYAENTGLASVAISGNAIIGSSDSSADGGYVYGGGKGAVDVGEDDITKHRYAEALIANVRETQVTIGTSGDGSQPTMRTVYGGGEDGHVNQNATVTIHNGTIKRSLFGGGKGTSTYTTTLWDQNNASNPKSNTELVHSWTAGKVYGNTTITMNGGSVGWYIYGGGNMASIGKGNYAGGTDDYSTRGYGELPPKNGDAEGELWSNTDFTGSGIARVNIYGGEVGKVIDVNDEPTGLPRGNVFGGSRGQAAADCNLSPRYRYVPDFFLGYVNQAIVTIGDKQKNTTPVIKGSVYGGGENGHIRNSAQVIVNKGVIGEDNNTNADCGNVFGAGSGIGTFKDGTQDKCNNSSGSITCTTNVEINGGTIYRNVYGGGALASVGPPFTGVQKDKNNKPYDEYKSNAIAYDETTARNHGSQSYTQVNIKGGEIKGSVYGASRGPSDDLLSSVFTEGNEYDAKRFATVIWSDVNVSGDATVTGSVYGGGEKGVVKHATNVNIGIAAVGNTSAIPFTGTISTDVYGGGKEAEVGGFVAVNINSGTVTQDVYGGGALAKTNTNKNSEAPTTGAKPTEEEENVTTIVNLFGGTVRDVYGGGLGDNTSGSEVAANVDGSVTVTVEGGKARNVFGCNNKYGTPKGTVEVVVNGTAATVISEGVKTYALQGVYGGGNLAHYDPVTPSTYPTVVVNGCETSIKDVYGGGNAAAVPYTNVTINGGDIDRVFAGGNGESGTAANIGYKNSDDAPNSGNYGAGTTNATIAGGTINQIYGGCNSKGTVRESGTLSIAKPTTEGSHCDMIIGDVYGGGNQAPGAAVALSIGCTGTGENEGITNVFGGANAADISGNILLNITEGKIANVFGGNNTSGSISGTITVNINKDANACAWYVGNVFGGGNLAAYSGSPVVNIINGTVSGNVYGGGKGVLASGTDRGVKGKVTGNPQVTIGDNVSEHTVTVSGSVYGGGDAASVDGTPVVLVNDCNTTISTSLYGGGSAADVNGSSITINGGNIGNAFGGGHGDKTVTVEPLKFADVNGNVTFNVYGGTIGNVFAGSNSSGRITGTSALTINKTGSCDMIIGAVYGGGNEAAGKASTINILCTGDLVAGTDGHIAHPENIGTTLEGIGTVYGGANQADIGATGEGNESNIEVNIKSGIVANVFGGNNTSGDIYGTITVNIEKDNNATCADNWYVGNVYGGGNLAAYTGSPAVNIKNGTVSGSVYGGGKGQSAVVTGSPIVTIGDATEGYVAIVTGDVYGGGDAAAVTGNTTVTYDDNNASSTVGNLFGGGNAAGVSGTSTVTLTSGKVNNGVYGGSNASGTIGSTNVTVTGGTVEDVFGGGYGANTFVAGNVEVNVGKSTTTTTGEGESQTTTTTISGDATINGDVYGGGALGHVNGTKNNAYTPGGTELPITPTTNATTIVNLLKGLIKGDAYGGGLGQKNGFNGATADAAAYVGGKVFVNLNGAAFNVDYENTTDVLKDANGNTVMDGENPKYVQVVKSGRVFGCNNLNGYPLYDVKVTVNKTVPGNRTRSTTANKNNADATFEVAAVYGGGNLADNSASGTKMYVEINGCEDTSVRYVYGGGNAAAVPATNVLVKAAYEIEYVFGGGNGKDKYKNDSGWQPNPGADVNGTVGTVSANTLLLGGVIHEAYGGSNELGTITGSVVINSDNDTNPDCTLDVGKIYGAGKNADINGDLIVILGCMPGDENPTAEVYGGAENANVKGNVELTITSGSFGKVFGGNNQSGAIFGHIKLNIEETGCTPIKIDELYLGGNQAAYSKYGYYQNGTIDGTSTGKPKYVARSSMTDGTAVVFGLPSETDDHTNPPYADPELNVVSFTRIGQVFGGGLGSGATLYGNPTVNINQTYGKAYRTEGETQVYDATATTLGEIGDVFGGGNAANVEGNTTINIATEATVNLTSVRNNPATEADESQRTVVGANITGNVYGGGNLADVTGNTLVNICAQEVGADTISVAEGAAKVTIGGDVYGGGQGEADNFFCNKAMVGTNNAGIDANYSDGNTTVVIGNGTINGNVYGGGKIARVEKNTKVMVGLGTGEATVTSTSSAPEIKGSVFGGGKGLETHGYAALVRGNPTVTIAGNAKVRQSVYGGGEIASVARYNVPQTEDDVAAAIAAGYTDAILGMPYALKDANSGICTVTVKGYSVIGPDEPMQMTKTGGPDDAGHVFGAGKGFLPENYTYADNEHRPKRMVLYDANKYNDSNSAYWDYVSTTDHNNVWEYFPNIDSYITFIQTQALSSYTYVTIDGNTLVKGSVYGGSENGIVQFNTDVKIKGGQIGAAASGSSECASWPYQAPYAPYDPYAAHYNSEDSKYYYDSGFTQEAAGGAKSATDGHTYYGNVFGGGSGSVPYFDNTLGRSVYLHSAGQVKGDTHVTISGGHILTNVYGGCEATNVTGTAYVTMTDGTIGVDRTDAQIIAHPVTGYLFGGGKGDQRIFFNKDTNVKDAVVKVEGGRIYGSVYGGGEDGHVLRNVTMTIGKAADHSGPTIGTQGTSYYDGHVFGGGRGFGGDALTAGNVGGAVTLTVEGGSILGSVYGGGRMASVGYGLYLTTETGYGIMRSDTEYDGSYTNPSTEEASMFFNKGRGHIIMNINGGTIGNTSEYTYDADNQLTHTKGGNVFAGGMGNFFKQDGTSVVDGLDWWKLGCVKSTKLTISGDVKIKSCVYGGGELGQVVGKQKDGIVGAEIIINGGTIGTEIKDGETVKYTFGSVFGGGYGSLEEKLTHHEGTDDEFYSYPKYIAGRVKGGTKVNMTAGAVLASVYGGGEMAAVGESTVLAAQTDPVIPGETLTGTGGKPMEANTYVIVSGGTIGVSGFGGAKMGNVYGGGSGHNNTVRSGHVYGNSNVTISGGTIYHNIYGGGAYGSVGEFVYKTELVSGAPKVTGISDLSSDHANTGVANVTITGGTIGVNGKENGMVFGSSRGDVNQPEERDDYTAWVYDANVTIGNTSGGPAIMGSVYGSGENGHTFNNAVVTVNNGIIGIASGEPIVSNNGTPDDTTDDITYNGAEYPYRGNVYGGGCGTDKYYAVHSQETHDGNGQLFNPLAGIVYGNATVNINGGTVVRNVYGAGAMGSVGKATTTEGVTTISGGQTTINVSGGTIGVSGTVGDGNVFGAARGDADATSNEFALVRKNTNVSITGGTMYGNVYGGGELGCVGTYTVSSNMRTFTWQDTDGNTNTSANSNNKNTGICDVKIDGSSAVINGHVFGAGKGKDDTFWCEKGIVYRTIVNVKNGTIKGNVYGGGEVGRVETDTEVKVGLAPGEGGGTSEPTINGSVFGGGAGVETHGYSALVRGNTTVTIDHDAHVGLSVYGGGEIASVGKYGLDAQNMPSILQGGGYCYVTVKGHASIGDDVFGAGKGITPHFDNTNADLSKRSRRMTLKNDWQSRVGTERFDWDYLTEEDYPTYLETLALATHPEVTIDGNAAISGSVFGGGELGLTKGSVIVNIQGGTIAKDVYGGGSLANTNTTSTVDFDGDGVTEIVNPTTKVNLTGGRIIGSAYGGGLGRKAATGVSAIEAIVYGDVLVDLNGTTTLGTEGKPVLDSYGFPTGTPTDRASRGCVVNQVFGCNNLNGTPKGNVVVHVYGTQHKDLASVSAKYNPPYYEPDKSSNEGYKEYLQRLIDAAYETDADGNVTTTYITGIPESAKTKVEAAKTVLSGLSSTAEASLTSDQISSITTAANAINQEFNALYDVYAVYGGGNEAAYEPAVPYTAETTTGSKAQVVIEGCDYSSIQYVYGGGNAAPVPETNILIKGNKIIDNLFGGGNGTVVGADIGYKKDGTTEQGTGNVTMNLMAGNIHNVFNGSNTNGNVRGNANRRTVNVPSQQSYQDECCSVLNVNKFFTAGKNADIEGDLIDVIDCQQNTWIDEYYGGAENANVKGNVELTIHSGKIRKLFGGNKTKGAIFGHIILNIEETGNCAPIMIDELYGCGNDAAYSIYGYYQATDEHNNPLFMNEEKTKPLYLPRTSADDPHRPVKRDGTEYASDETFTPYDPPVLNIVSATHIGKVFGGGYGVNGAVYGSPTVNINMIPGSHAQAELGGADKLGTIGDVYGGGNAADVIGNTTVNIGTASKVRLHESYEAPDYTMSTEEYTVMGANITGNVFGGGMGEATTFTCEKAMVGKDGDGENTEKGNTNITIAKGTIGGSVYGGGEIARVENNTVVTIGTGNGGTGSAPVIMGNVFGAGKGIKTHGYSALVRGTTTVTIQGDAKVGQSVYGGGEIASVGNFFVKGVTYPAELHAPTPPDDFPEGMPYALKYPDSNNGTCTVTIRGNAEIGPNDMTMPTFSGHVFGAGKGLLPEVYDSNNKPHRMIGGNADEYFASESKYIEFIETLGMSAATEVTIDGNAFVKGSVYGGSENGHVLKDTHVTIDGQCQIGNGYNTTTNKGVNQRYTDWSSESLYECAHWPYGRKIGGTDENPVKEYLPYDVYDYVDPTATNPVPKAASDGHTFYGNVFGGGSGYFPYRKNPNWVKDEAKSAVAGCPVDANGYSDGLWLRSAGAVYGNTFVDIKNGHILTSVYGGNECTDVGKYQTNSIIPEAETGHCTVNMVGGTIGVPRTEQQMKDHPVTCYLFGAGKGDQRINFNTWTNVASTQVNISGTARIYGSTFGGGEDGHVIGDAETNIGGSVTIGATSYSNEGVVIGTTGTSYVDGNVFGGGRGFSGDAQTAGSVGGNARLNIYGGTMLGSIYGGGRLASVGTQFSQPEEPTYGQFNEDDANHSYGHVTVNISGGTIGNTVGNAVSGNVFGGSMGRLTLLDNKTINPLWPELAQVKTATVNISGNNTLIKRNVYGGGEYGSLRENTYITIGGTRAANGTISPSGKPTISGNVFGGGYGSDDYNNPTTVEVHWNNATAYYTYTPMQWAGCVGGNTNVDIVGGKVKQNVYGGGQMASVGIIDYSVKEDNNGPFTYNNKKYAYKNIVKHADIVDEGTVSEKVYGFGLSWPYEFTYVPCKPGTTDVGGKTTVTVSGGRIGADGSWDDGTGYVFGAGKGKAFERYTEAFCANVRESEVNIDYTTTADPADVRTADCIASAVYGGGEDGHVYENSAVNITGGLIGLSVYGGGKGEGTYKGKLRSRDGNHDWNDELVDLPSWTAGKVYGNTTVNMTGGHVLVNVYGGGNMGSVGKGNYASGTDDYYPAGYGETLNDEELWTSSSSYDPDIAISATNKPTTMADYFLGSGKTKVTITGGTVGTSNGVYRTVQGIEQKTPTGMVFGGSRGRAAEDIGRLSPRYAFAPDFFLGYVNNTKVTIGNSSGGPTIYSQVFGGGRDGHVRNSSHVIINKGTIGQAYDDYNTISDNTDRENQRRNCGNVYASGSGMGTWDGTHHGTSSGSITRNATVDVNGGTIYGNVYGGGAMSSVGPPKIGADAVYAAENWSKCTVNINGGTIGVGTDFSTYGYGGCVFGASRGGDLTTDEFSEGNLDNYATTLWNEVNIKGGTIAGDVYGGGQAGRVKKNNKVILTGGTVNHEIFGGGMGTSTIAANVGGDVLVTLNGTETPGEGGTVTYNDNAVVKGSVFGANNVNGTPEGHVTVHVFKTAPAGHSHGYDVTSVFGGGKKADYVPTDNVQSTEVIIEGCDLTSIEEVYGGGYGAATPGTSVLIKGTKIIDNVFGGGYGDGNHTDPSAANYNPGANVGYLSDGITPIGLEKDGGKAVVQLMAGTVNHVYGGSNSLGDIRGGSNVTSVVRGTGDVRPNCCTELNVQEIYGGGKQADMFGGAEIVLGCMPNDWIGAIYGGAANADVKNDVSLTLTSGKFGRVFGGNKSGGNIEGYIEVNIEENPDCSTPIIIGELYGGGDAAPYTLPSRYITENNPNYQSPRVNVRSFTSIGNVYGGGYGAAATVKGNPMVNINEVVVATDNEGNPISKAYDPDGDTGKPSFIDGVNVKLYPHEAKKIGVIGNVFGGGNAAKVEGNTYVNIGTTAEEQMVSLQTKDAQGQVVIVKKPVKGADIRGNVYGGGNAAEVTGQTNVVIGKEKVQ